jgi:cytochrome b561
MLKNTKERYGTVTKTLHWVTALCVLGLLGVGLYMDEIHDLSVKLRVYNLHKSFGICVLSLTVFRVVWHFYSRKPAYIATLKSWEKAGARLVHSFLYVALIGMPLTGWLMSSAAGRSVSVFGLFVLPDLVTVNKQLGDFFYEAHGYLAYALMAAIAGHAAAALKHHFIDKDLTLKRMLPFVKVL